MRPRYGTSAIVLGRSALAEASSSLALLTESFGLVRARAQGIRKPGAKMAGATQTLSECDVLLVRGKDGWRLSGATCVTPYARELTRDARRRAGRVATLVLRLVHGEAADPVLYTLFAEFLAALPTLSDEDADAAEVLAALRILSALGLAEDTEPEGYESSILARIRENRSSYIQRINRGLGASGL